jgi:hypothetical protein
MPELAVETIGARGGSAIPIFQHTAVGVGVPVYPSLQETFIIPLETKSTGVPEGPLAFAPRY